jgi:hypothetical protein
VHIILICHSCPAQVVLFDFISIIFIIIIIVIINIVIIHSVQNCCGAHPASYMVGKGEKAAEASI